MSRYLSDILQADEPSFTLAVRELERATGHPAADIRLTRNLKDSVVLKLRELGLDPTDTSGEELYHGLMGLVRLHDGFLLRALGGEPEDDVNTLLQLMKQKIDDIPLNKKVWVVKPVAVKKLIKKMPPKKVMKQLGYKSVDSMLKRQSVAEILGAAHVLETVTWRNRFIKQYKNFTSSDFESRNIEVVLLDAKRMQEPAAEFVRQRHHNIIDIKELGAIVLLPLSMTYRPGLCITVFPLLLHYMNELRVYSAYFKYNQVRADFGDVLVDTLSNGMKAPARLAGQDIHWKTIHRHFGRDGNTAHSEVFEPHVQSEDLEWRQAEDILYRIEPALLFWRGLDFVGSLHDRTVVSLNLRDMAVSCCNALAYGEHAVSGLRESLWHTLLCEYLGRDVSERSILSQLDHKVNEADLFIETMQLKGSY